VRKTIKLKLSKKLRSDIRLAIKRGRRPRVKVRVLAVDSRGNAITKRVGVTVTG
jgi:hypothetical protein